MAGDAEKGLGEVGDEVRPVADGGGEEGAPGFAVVGAELGGGGFEVVLEGDGGAVV